MRILVISTVSYDLNGIAMVIKNLYVNRVFEKEGISFFLPKNSDTAMVDELENHNFRVMKYDSRTKKPFKYIKQLTDVIKKGKYDIVHIHGNSHTVLLELWAAKRAGCAIRIVHAHTSACKYKTIHRLLALPFHKLYTHGFACSRAAGRFMFGDKECVVINNAFDTAKYQFDDILRKKYRQDFQIENDVVVIGHVGGINYQKNQSFLVKAFKIYHDMNPKSVLLLIGKDGGMQAFLEEEISRLKLQKCVLLLGGRTDVAEILNAMDCFVFPSTCEGLGIAPIEAQANGLPVICACDNIPDVIKINENFKFLSLAQGEQKWAEEIDQISKERFLQGVTHVAAAGYDIGEEVERLRDIYNDLVKSKKG